MSEKIFALSLNAKNQMAVLESSGVLEWESKANSLMEIKVLRFRGKNIYYNQFLLEIIFCNFQPYSMERGHLGPCWIEQVILTYLLETFAQLTCQNVKV